ncbi:penicillin-binding transpeptidase domain-containing protein [Desulfurobacterium thermolithotrophum]|uniref:penicillin-binding transpeptidase domain-containing protein n=1 Tax=Desulfurobacterium thermolithotrophum TaxID=64160 RepID=UPI0013D2E4E4|nr:penicillin-binding transpeptidase domain-containing protein [Desulfurobacterium thermolithotrophum]
MKKVQVLVSLLLLFTLFGFVVHNDSEEKRKIEKRKTVLEFKETETKSSYERLNKLLKDFSYQYYLFKKAKLENGKYVYHDKDLTIVFTVDPQFQERLEKKFKYFKIKYGAYVALDALTGKVLAAVSSLDYPDLTIKRTFPTASTFKIVTAATAIETGIADLNTSFICGGHDDSCSPSVWLNSRYRVKRNMKDSFAFSSNPFFGNLGRLIGEENLLKFAEKFGFNRKDYGFPWGIIRKPLDGYDLALMAAGLGETRTSPFHEALIALTIENQGIMLKPSLVEKVYDSDGKLLFSFKKEKLAKVVSPSTANKIKTMMLMTVKYGTVSDRKYFRKLKWQYPNLVIGGKSGTLSELTYPEGRCEWFTGFMEYGGKKIAFSSLAVNGSKYYLSGYELAAVASMDFVKLNSTFAKN